MTLDELMREKGAKVLCKVNKLLIPCHVCDNTKDGAHEFNQYYQEVLKLTGWNTIVRTPSGGVSIARQNFKPPMWDIKATNACIEITLIGIYMLRIQFRQNSSVKEDNQPKIYGREAFSAFKKWLLLDGIDLEDYAIDNGAEVKKTIPKYIIKMENEKYKDCIFKNVHHIDFHNSFPAGLVNTHPEFGGVITMAYNTRKTRPINKAILNYSIGFMQSISMTGAQWAHLAKDAIEDNNKRVEELAAKVAASGRLILSYNTDGFWYAGEIYHGEGEGKALGQWENDHINCKFRAKSAGAYEYIEDGNYFPVVRGRTNLDLIKPRTEWEWGDIYRREAQVIEFFWEEGVGLTYKDGSVL